MVLERGDLSDCRNPSSAVIGRLRDATVGASQGGAGGRQLERAVEEFIQVSQLDERATAALREAPPEAQQMVLERGDLSDCRNPSSAVIGRLRDATQAASPMSMGPPSSVGVGMGMSG